MMRRLLTSVTTLSFVLVAIASCPVVLAEKPADTISEKLQGRWEIVAGVNQGRELTKQELAGTYVTVTANSMVTYDSNQQQRFQAVFVIDQSTKPIQITLTSVPVSAAEDESTPAVATGGIVKLSGSQKWVLCYALPGADRPTKFESADGSKVMLFYLQKKQGDPLAKVADAEQE